MWFSERALHEEGSDGSVADTLQGLEDKGHLYEADGALWMRTTDFGDDKDRVLIRSNGELTYFASDTAYYLNKRERGFDRCIYLLGADHHGYVGRLRAMAACVGDDPAHTLEVLIGQLVKILRDGEELRLSKRAGTIVTLDELVDEIGVDALRYSLARYPADTPLTLDVDEITKASNDNPVYYVQYAHARTCRMMENAADLGMTLPGDAFDPSLLDHEREGDLLRALAEFPRVVASAAELREPHRIARYLEDTAAVFNRWYDTKECRMLPQGDEPVAPVNEARLVLSWPPRGRCSPTASTCSASPLPSGCEPCPPPTRPAGRTPTAPCAPGSALAASAGRPQRARPAPVVVDRPQGRRRARGRRRRPARPGRRARQPGVRPRRGRLPRACPGLRATRSPTTTSSTPARRSSPRPPRAGWPRRACTSTSAPAAS